MSPHLTSFGHGDGSSSCLTKDLWSIEKHLRVRVFLLDDLKGKPSSISTIETSGSFSAVGLLPMAAAFFVLNPGMVILMSGFFILPIAEGDLIIKQ